MLDGKKVTKEKREALRENKTVHEVIYYQEREPLCTSGHSSSKKMKMEKWNITMSGDQAFVRSTGAEVSKKSWQL